MKYGKHSKEFTRCQVLKRILELRKHPYGSELRALVSLLADVNDALGLDEDNECDWEDEMLVRTDHHAEYLRLEQEGWHDGVKADHRLAKYVAWEAYARDVETERRQISFDGAVYWIRNR